MGGAVGYVNSIAGFELALGDDAQVRAWPVRSGEPLEHQRIAEPEAELEAREPGLADLELDGPDPPVLADNGVRDVDAAGGQVLAEHAGAEVVAPQLFRPPGDVLRRVGVHGLVGAAVHAPVGLIVTGEIDAFDPDASGHGSLADRAHLRPAAPDPDLLRATDIDGDELGHGMEC